ncbi:MAG: DUF6171 family protein [Blautia sp.]
MDNMIKSAGRICRKCLLQDMDENAYFEDLRQYIARIDAELKVEDDKYKERLDVCRECDNLMNGMCRICGCFVEMRAVMKKNSCPGIPPRWERTEKQTD